MSITINQTLETIICATCCIAFAVPGRLVEDRRKDGAMFYCPNQHGNTFGEGMNARLRRERDAAIMREQAERDQRAAAELERDKLKKRIANGCCPCCNRNFKHLQQHIKTKHPHYVSK